jgi:hypothetical protein
MPRTTTQTQARATARERQAQKNEARRLRDEAELAQGETFEVARQRRDGALDVVATSEVEMGHAVAALFELGNQAGQVAVLTGETETEVKRLRRLATDTAAAGAARPSATPAATRAGSADAGAVPTGSVSTPAAATLDASRDRTELAGVAAGNS